MRCRNARISKRTALTAGLLLLLATACDTVPSAEATSVKMLDDHAQWVRGVAIAPDGKRAASIGDEGLVVNKAGGRATQGVLRIWELDGCNRKVVVPFNTQLFAVKFLPHGSQIAVGGWGGVNIVQARDGKILQTFQGIKERVEALAVSRDGSTIASAGGGFVQFWNVRSGRELKSERHEADVVSAMDLTRDGRLLFAGGYANNTTTERTYFVQLWDVGHRARDLQIGYPTRTAFRDAVLIGDDRRVVVAGPSGTIEEWDVRTEKHVREWASHGGAECLALTRDGRFLASGSLRGKVTLWDVASAQPVMAYEEPRLACTAIAVSDNARRLVAGTSKGKVWQIDLRRD